MQINFAVKGEGGSKQDEAAALRAVAAGKLPAEEKYLFGWLSFKHQGKPELSFNDDLGMLFPSITATIESLRSKGRAELNMVSYFCHLTFAVEGNELLVLQKDNTLDNQEIARYPKEAFITALADCHRRFTAYAEKLAKADPDWKWVADSLAK